MLCGDLSMLCVCLYKTSTQLHRFILKVILWLEDFAFFLLQTIQQICIMVEENITRMYVESAIFFLLINLNPPLIIVAAYRIG